nr:MAG TPA: hypothetical protein [Caudoviricetes sp.]
MRITMICSNLQEYIKLRMYYILYKNPVFGLF